MSHLQDMKKQIGQLQHQAFIERITVSKAIEDLIKYCIEHQNSDVLVTGVLNGSDNHFEDSKSCAIL